MWAALAFLPHLQPVLDFLLLLVADMKVMQNFGLFASLGIALAFITMVVAVPLMLSFVHRLPQTARRRTSRKRRIWTAFWRGRAAPQLPESGQWLLVNITIVLVSIL